MSTVLCYINMMDQIVFSIDSRDSIWGVSTFMYVTAASTNSLSLPLIKYYVD